ncbi:MAG TPA: hypothetical protein VMR41_00020 [Patescibacteria group bacterium]|nr:hypothetical protein [Patescibacteria group bacterium]
METFKKYLPYLLIGALCVLIYKVIFSPYNISGGDYESYSAVSIINFIHYSFSAWENKINFGWSTIGLLHGALLNFIFGWLGYLLQNSIYLTERLVWWIPFIIFSVFSSILLYRRIISHSGFKYLSVLIYSFNTYILLIISGGQIAGIGLAYAIAPALVYSLINLIEKQNVKNSILFSLLLSLAVLFDLRSAYILILGVYLYFVLYLIYTIILNKQNLYTLLFKNFFFVIILPVLVVVLLHSFWLLPISIVHQNPLDQFGSGYTTNSAVQFFSFAKIEDSISLLHPNWPENIFGKTYFMRPEFLFLPILAFLSLLFVNRKKKQEGLYIIYFAILGLLGAFLAKGANDPFGGIYLWMFDHVPGFIMFRDPTKWYLLVALSYSILIPFTIGKIYERLKFKPQFSIINLKFQIKSKFKIFNYQYLFLIFTTLYLILLIRSAIFGQLGGTFKPAEVPKDYVKLEQFLSSQNNFSRTFWVPTTQRFGFYSDIHPEVSATDFYSLYDSLSITKALQKVGAEKQLQEAGVKYVIVPYDPEGEIYLSDRKYDEKLYRKVLDNVSKISYLHKVNGFGEIGVYQVSDPMDHFWSPANNLVINYQYNSPVQYDVTLKNAHSGDKIVFAESYDVHWIATENGQNIASIPYDKRYNSFLLNKNGSYSINIYYSPQTYVNIGIIVSGVTFAIVVGYLLFVLVKRK